MSVDVNLARELLTPNEAVVKVPERGGRAGSIGRDPQRGDRLVSLHQGRQTSERWCCWRQGLVIRLSLAWAKSLWLQCAGSVCLRVSSQVLRSWKDKVLDNRLWVDSEKSHTGPWKWQFLGRPLRRGPCWVAQTPPPSLPWALGTPHPELKASPQTAVITHQQLCNLTLPWGGAEGWEVPLILQERMTTAPHAVAKRPPTESRFTWTSRRSADLVLRTTDGEAELTRCFRMSLRLSETASDPATRSCRKRRLSPDRLRTGPRAEGRPTHGSPDALDVKQTPCGRGPGVSGNTHFSLLTSEVTHAPYSQKWETCAT